MSGSAPHWRTNAVSIASSRASVGVSGAGTPRPSISAIGATWRPSSPSPATRSRKRWPLSGDGSGNRVSRNEKSKSWASDARAIASMETPDAWTARRIRTRHTSPGDERAVGSPQDAELEQVGDEVLVDLCQCRELRLVGGSRASLGSVGWLLHGRKRPVEREPCQGRAAARMAAGKITALCAPPALRCLGAA